MIIFKNEVLGTLVSMISWIAPTQNVDGTEIDYELSYMIYVDGVAMMQVQVDSYQLAAIAAIQEPGTYTLQVSAYPSNVDLALRPELESDLSNAITIRTVELQRPKAPADFSAE